MRIVLDTNVVLSALLWRGTPYRLLAAIREHPAIQLCSSQALLDELAEVLTRSSFARRLAAIDRTAHGVLVDYVGAVEIVEPEYVPRVVLADADDDQVIAAAVTAGTDWIVSGDTDLLSLGNHQGISIITVAEAIRRIAGVTHKDHNLSRDI